MTRRPVARLLRQAAPAPVWLGLAALLLIATRQTYTVRFTGLGLTPAQLILLAFVVLWLVTRLVGQRTPAGLGLLNGLVVLLLLATLASYGLCQSSALTADQRTGSDRAVLLLTIAVAVVTVLATVLRTPSDLELVLRGLVLGGALSGLFAIVQFATGVDIASYLHGPGLADTGGSVTTLVRVGLDRPQGSAAAALELGGVMTILIPVGLGVVFACRRRGERSWTWAVAVALMLGGAAVSLSRSVFIGLAVAVLVMLPRWPVRRTVAAFVGAVVVVVVAAVVASGLVGALTTLLVSGSQDYSLASRSDGRTYVWTHFADHFWFGQGPGTYDLTTQKVLDNQYLSQLMEGGVVGALLLGAVLACALGYAIRAGRRPDPDDGDLAADGRGLALAELGNGLAGAVAAAMVVSSVLDTSGFTQVFTLIWFLVGLAGAAWRLARRPAHAGPQRAAVVTPAGVAAR